MFVRFCLALSIAFTLCVFGSACRRTVSASRTKNPSQAERKGEATEASPTASGSAAIARGQWSEIGDEVEPDAEIDAIIKPYREKLIAVMEEEIGVAQAALVRGRPESPLGNLVADAILQHAQREIDPDTDLSLMNRGGIRLPELPAGPITVADIYQLVPFDNRVVVLTLTGRQVEAIITTLASNQGEPMSGVVYQLERDASGDERGPWKGTNIRLQGSPLAPDQTYKLATLDYLAGIGGELAVLQEASHRIDGELFLRDVMINDIRQRKTVTPVIDGRVTYANEENE